MIEVVAAAIVRDGQVLAAHRSAGPTGWEFPGGKVDADESARDALVREIGEELGAAVVVGSELGASQNRELRLTLYSCALAGDEPTLGPDHDRLRWLTAAELDTPDWLPLDAALLEPVRAHLAGHRPTPELRRAARRGRL